MENNIFQNKLISIVVPVYNVEKYIEKCIVSIINQTYTNIEIIIVNDGTKDNSLEVIKKYINNDKRIRVINQENAGLSEARNTGIKNALGQYILFVDSDDFIDKKMVEKMYKKLQEDNSQIVMCNICRWDYLKDEELGFRENYYGEKEIFNNDEAVRALLLNKINGYAWNKLYDINLFKNIRYIKGILFEDMFTTFDLILKTNQVSVVKDKLYYYVSRDDSITKNMTKKAILDLNHRIEYVSEKIDINQYRDEFSRFSFFFYLMSIDWVYNYRHQNKGSNNDKEFRRIINQKNDIKHLNILNNNNITNKEKFKYILMRAGLLGSAYKLKYLIS